jgi:hypothetical protein
MKNVFGDGILIFGILLFYFSMMILWSKGLKKRISKKNKENENNPNDVVFSFLHIEVVLFILVGGVFFTAKGNDSQIN